MRRTSDGLPVQAGFFSPARAGRVALPASVATAALVPLMAATAHAADPVADEAAFVAETTALRASVGQPALEVDSRLAAMARSWAATMAAGGRIWHNPDLA